MAPPALSRILTPPNEKHALYLGAKLTPTQWVAVAKMRILIVDDNPQVRAAILSILMTDPRLEIVSEAANGTEALELAQDLQPDLILLDIGLPDLNGLEVAQHLAKLTPRCGSLFLSQHTSSEIVRSTLSCGGLGYVVKSDAALELVPAVLAAASGRKYLSKRVRTAETDPDT
jgi:DNA-binding NarL/FixJ family response regulator